ncbi:unnamed protein product [Durusdinium trenchii]|uniref:SET domain-containing protein n=1 Tax=Durusdinium trenchii TaxID=1381693 RepID=A0ABP0LZ38_9DINO
MADALLSWGLENSAFVHDGIDLFARSDRAARGLRTRRPLQAKEVLLRIPGHMSVQSHLSLMPDSPLSEFWRRRCAAPVSNVLRLTLTLIHELHVQKSESRWWPYLSFLQSSVEVDLPIWWPESDLQGLKGTALWLSAKPREVSEVFEEVAKPVMAQEVSLWPPQVQQLPLFLQALSWVMSRGFCGALSFDLQGAVIPELSVWDAASSGSSCSSASPTITGPFLLPLFDLINHSSWPEERCVELEMEGEDFVVRASKEVAADSELFKSYGDHSDAELLRTYGFVEQGRNPNNVLLATHQELLDACRAMEGQCTERLERLGTEAVYAIPATGVLPAELLTVVQVLLMSPSDYGEFHSSELQILGKKFHIRGSAHGQKVTVCTGALAGSMCQLRLAWALCFCKLCLIGANIYTYLHPETKT